jgi:hypothetical protein
MVTPSEIRTHNNSAPFIFEALCGMDTADLSEAARFRCPVPSFRHSRRIVLVAGVPGAGPIWFRGYFRICTTSVFPFPTDSGTHPRGFSSAVFCTQKLLHSEGSVSVIELEWLRIVVVSLPRQRVTCKQMSNPRVVGRAADGTQYAVQIDRHKLPRAVAESRR